MRPGNGGFLALKMGDYFLCVFEYNLRKLGKVGIISLSWHLRGHTQNLKHLPLCVCVCTTPNSRVDFCAPRTFVCLSIELRRFSRNIRALNNSATNWIQTVFKMILGQSYGELWVFWLAKLSLLVFVWLEHLVKAQGSIWCRGSITSPEGPKRFTPWTFPWAIFIRFQFLVHYIQTWFGDFWSL